MLSDNKYITWKLIYFCIISCKELFNIEDASRVIGSFLINPQLKCFDFSQTFHGLLLSLQKKIEMKIFMNQSQESLEKSSWISIAMLWSVFNLQIYWNFLHITGDGGSIPSAGIVGRNLDWFLFYYEYLKNFSNIFSFLENKTNNPSKKSVKYKVILNTFKCTHPYYQGNRFWTLREL